MDKSQRQVLDFHKKFGAPVKERPEYNGGEVNLRIRLIAEELEEFINACGIDAKVLINTTGMVREPDLVEMADALGDIKYVVDGAALTFGIDLEPISDEIHASNMTKWPNKDANGKITKGPNYRPPELATIIKRQQERGIILVGQAELNYLASAVAELQIQLDVLKQNRKKICPHNSNNNRYVTTPEGTITYCGICDAMLEDSK